MKKFILIFAFLVSTNVVFGQQFKETTNIINVQDTLSYVTYKYFPGETLGNIYFQLGQNLVQTNKQILLRLRGKKEFEGKTKWTANNPEVFSTGSTILLNSNINSSGTWDLEPEYIKAIILIDGKEYIVIVKLEQRQ